MHAAAAAALRCILRRAAALTLSATWRRQSSCRRATWPGTAATSWQRPHLRRGPSSSNQGTGRGAHRGRSGGRLQPATCGQGPESEHRLGLTGGCPDQDLFGRLGSLQEAQAGSALRNALQHTRAGWLAASNTGGAHLLARAGVSLDRPVGVSLLAACQVDALRGQLRRAGAERLGVGRVGLV